ncbi:MAG TPA: hypothetical protein VK028_13935 [Micromonosporaceae bacterium]|nr:hypothetical protein [Micromonosporaceae bacterium]
MTDHPSSAPTRDSAPAGGSGRKRRLLLVLVMTMAGIVLIGAIGAVVVYDRATAIDRSTPALAARHFLHAAVDENDSNQVGLHICGSWSAEDALAAVRIADSLDVDINWAVTAVNSGDPGHAEVAVRVSVASAGVSAELTEVWVLEAVEDDGWRICSIRRESLQP